MTIYVTDGLTGDLLPDPYSLDLDELHTFAKEIGISEMFFFEHQFPPHYEVLASERSRALRAGALILRKGDWFLLREEGSPYTGEDAFSFAHYQIVTGGTVIYQQANIDPLAYVALGLAGETGEITNQIKKVFRDDGGTLSEKRAHEILSEAGDALWYLTRLIVELGGTLEGVARENAYKLHQRQKRGTLHGDGDKR